MNSLGVILHQTVAWSWPDGNTFVSIEKQKLVFIVEKRPMNAASSSQMLECLRASGQFGWYYAEASEDALLRSRFFRIPR